MLSQGLSYNFQNNELVWAETFGDDERNSSCNIVQKYLHNNEENVIGSFENCYPFAITSDYGYVYWSDWGRNGIMRLSKDNVSENLIKLFSTPPLETDEGHHNGAFGITNLGKLSSAKIKEVCLERYPKNKTGNSQNVNVRQSNVSEEQRGNSTDNQSASYNDKFDFNYLKKIHKMKIIIIFLVCSCSFLFFVTLFLIIRNLMNSRCMDGIRKCCANTIGKRISSSPVKSKTHRRYKPKMISRRGSLCAKENDGVKIDIEDCCQMTLCETPCFTTIKKEGKGYKAPKKSSQDKEKLLCDLENI
ncbi:hypothetical protein Anas_03551 [Armadillidium nasatum]|uniref:Uncharacterized protein n=1 Tax=Armadillidium nasatum TaxID=96803 RepID=A0A5N5T0T2_9CRUS|nr:hypothetical protein Anas_03551 [Armadillidium nasatum]